MRPVLAFLGAFLFAPGTLAQARDPAPGATQGRIVHSFELGASLFNSNTGFIRAKAANLSVGVLFDGWSVGMSTGPNFWRMPLFGTDEQEHVGVWNLGAYVEWRFAQDRARAMLGAGASIVVEPTAVDARAGAWGGYIDARPLGLRFPIRREWAVGLDPLSTALRVSDFGGVPLVEVQFMTWMRVEVQP